MSSYSQYLKSPEWAKLREKALKRDNHRCRLCNSAVSLHVHHRVYPKVLGEEAVDDLTTLCTACHSSYHGKWAATCALVDKLQERVEKLTKRLATQFPKKKKRKSRKA